MSEQYIIDTPQLFESLKEYYNQGPEEYFVYDVETDSAIEVKAHLYGLGFTFDGETLFYIPFITKQGNEIWTKSQKQEIASWVLQVSQNTKGVAHNGIYDILVLLYTLGIDLTEYLYHDTILSAHLIDEESLLALKELGIRYFGQSAINEKTELLENIKANGGKTTKDNLEIFKADTSVIAKYCVKDVKLTYDLLQIFDKKLKEEDLDKLFYEEEVMPLYKLVTIPMKKHGFNIDENYFKQLKQEIELEINKLEEEIYTLVKSFITQFELNLLNQEVPIKTTGNFPKYAAKLINFALPEKNGKISLAKSEIDKILEPQLEEHRNFLYWLKGKESLDPTIAFGAQKLGYFEKNSDNKHIFNLRSNDHLIELLINQLKLPIINKTKGGKPQIDDDFLCVYKNKKGIVNQIITKLLEFKQLNKVQSTYLDGILERVVDGKIYTGMLQFGTTSGRYSSRNPNLQNLPRPKEEDSGLSELVLKYVNSIRKGFIAPKGYKIVDADYESLEPTCFAEMSGSEKLKEVFKKRLDLYSSIAIESERLQKEFSADKKATNYLKNHRPDLRTKYKPIVLGIVYGAEETRVSQLLGCSKEEARQVINNYLSAYPDLRTYMRKCDYEAKTQGQVKTSYGRIRHLTEAKRLHKIYGNDLLDYRWASSKGLKEERWRFKNLLNNAKNVKIQGLAAHIINRSMIQIAKELKDKNLDAYIALMIHDQVICVSRADQAEQVKQIMKYHMENTIKLSIPLVADPKIADNLKESH
jgi:DNA polymerase I-like protein with 3'-5' exonuclease and polymerase domains